MPTILVAAGLGVFAYLSGNSVFAGYLGIPYIAGVGEMVIFCATIFGAGLGFLWFNTYPAQVFMGDVGALALGAGLRHCRCYRSSGSGASDYGWYLCYGSGVCHLASRFVQNDG